MAMDKDVGRPFHAKMDGSLCSGAIRLRRFVIRCSFRAHLSSCWKSLALDFEPAPLVSKQPLCQASQNVSREWQSHAKLYRILSIGHADPGTLPEREFIGYGLTPPDPKWPGGAKIAVNFLVNYWYGSELNPELGDHTHECLHLDLPPGGTGPLRNDMNEAQYEYGGKEGLPRLLALFAK